MEDIEARLQRIEEMLVPLSRSAEAANELKRDLEPRVNEAVRAVIIELAEVEPDFQIEDLLFLLKKMARSTRHLTDALDLLNKGIDLLDVSEPLLRDSVPQFIESLDRMERNGVFALGQSLLDVMEEFSKNHSRQDIDRLQKTILGLMQAGVKLSGDRSLENLDRLAEVPDLLDLDRVAKAGILDMLKALREDRVRRGMGVLLNLLRALGESLQADQPGKAFRSS
ncbi:MAG: DUF1641 domain-containing protein [Desulfobacterales bacterium]|nr:DUF1641 domain-containing protein [Desulfobacterales bacterium]